MSDTKQSLTYKDAGVDIDAGNSLVARIKDVTKKTFRPEVKSNIGGFGALCSIPSKYENPLLVSGTDGVGTKLKLAIDCKRHDGIGIDLVAMCVNDLIVQGAEPLFFLDYYATGELDVDVAANVVAGIGKGCEISGCALIGGETAEMPGMYSRGDYDVAGFCVGVVEASKVIDGTGVKAGNKLIALGSSGPHSNGYSLIRKVIEMSDMDLSAQLDNKTVQDSLLEPTKIYVKSVLNVLESYPLNAISHITGGGFWENIPRVLPDGMCANIDQSTWDWPSVFRLIQEKGKISTHEMYRTFNCGVGLVIAVDSEIADEVATAFANQGENAWVIGSVTGSDNANNVMIE